MNYHVNQETGKHGKCDAKVRACPVQGDVKHFKNESDAIANGTQVMENKFGL